jgi:hypothetical protein
MTDDFTPLVAWSLLPNVPYMNRLLSCIGLGRGIAWIDVCRVVISRHGGHGCRSAYDRFSHPTIGRTLS